MLYCKLKVVVGIVAQAINYTRWSGLGYNMTTDKIRKLSQSIWSCRELIGVFIKKSTYTLRCRLYITSIYFNRPEANSVKIIKDP